MPYLRNVSGPWGFRRVDTFRPPDMTDEQANEVAIRDMCDYGARQVALGKADELEFRIVPNERSYIDRYMAEKHPTIAYTLCASIARRAQSEG